MKTGGVLLLCAPVTALSPQGLSYGTINSRPFVDRHWPVDPTSSGMEPASALRSLPLRLRRGHSLRSLLLSLAALSSCVLPSPTSLPARVALPTGSHIPSYTAPHTPSPPPSAGSGLSPGLILISIGLPLLPLLETTPLLLRAETPGPLHFKGTITLPSASS